MPDKQIDMYQDLYPEGGWYISESKKMTGQSSEGNSIGGEDEVGEVGGGVGGPVVQMVALYLRPWRFKPQASMIKNGSSKKFLAKCTKSLDTKNYVRTSQLSIEVYSPGEERMVVVILKGRNGFDKNSRTRINRIY